MLCTALGIHGNPVIEQGHREVVQISCGAEVILADIEHYAGLDVCCLSLGCPVPGHLKKAFLI